MNYVSIPRTRLGNASIRHLDCCAICEALLASIPGDAKVKVKETILSAIMSNKTWIIWSLVPEMANWYDDVGFLLEKLPGTRVLGGAVNLNSGNRVYVYVTNLSEEWGPNDKLPFDL
jgi:hypothetical protein